MNLLEESQQEIPRTPERLGLPVSSAPLHDLEDQAPEIPSEYFLPEIGHPFSNDEMAAYYSQLQARTSTEDYKQASNRTAIIVGEGHLMSALPYIPEETIILLDNSAPMLAFMKRYVESLRTADGANDWGDMMHMLDAQPGTMEHKLTDFFFENAESWVLDGYLPAITDEESFKASQGLARQKAIIPWHGDITNRRDMTVLGQALKARNANVTFMNLSNVMSDSKTFETAAEFARKLKPLPLTPGAPIMTTTTAGGFREGTSGPILTRQATGPFFGLDNLAEHGGNVSVVNPNPGAVALRQYAGIPEGSFNGVPLNFLASLLANSIREGQNGEKEIAIPMPGRNKDNVIVVPVDEIPSEVRQVLNL